MRLAQEATPKPEGLVADTPTANVVTERVEPRPERSSQPENPSPYASFGQAHAVKEKKAADDLAAMILADLGKVAGCPTHGISVTVYGSNPWNSWLSFGARIGPLPNKVELQEFCDLITERLKRLYDVAE
ncbi:hypothetical protein SAMN05444171_1102 [Bradyrhizobium lablabi]|uniref:Uncharacterized protein n=3 Tax=Nitrobacteraceae TaxID=41294 RepID=A0ABY0Q7Q0_9BRAD|nr:hypothetical protein SAMN05444163_6058 [Bradyrhizobium ottawaense]SEC30575.1 hypothetical protein SAMN05444171_1102 [Bradyrhizobium lablabi]